MAGKIQNQGVKSEAELTSGGATKSSLLNDDKVYVNAFALDKTERSALLAFDIGDGDSTLRMSANSAGADTKLYFKGNTRKIIDGSSKVASPIDEALGSFVDSNIDFQTGTVTGGSFLYNNAAFTLPSTTIGQHRRFAFILQFDGSVSVNYSAAAASVGALAAPETLLAGYSGIAVGYIDLEATAATAFKTSGSATNIIENQVSTVSRIFNFGPGSSLGVGANDFRVGSIAANVATIKKGSIILGDGRELMTYDGSNLNTAVSINLKTQVNSAGVTSPAASTAYYLYLDLQALGAATTYGSTDREVYAVAQGTSNPFVVLITKPAAVDLSRYVPLAALKTDGSSNYTAYSNLSLRRHQGPTGGGAPIVEYDAGSYSTTTRTINLDSAAQQKFFVGTDFDPSFPIELVGGSLDRTYYVRFLFSGDQAFTYLNLFSASVLLPADKQTQYAGPYNQLVFQVVKRASNYEGFLLHELSAPAVTAFGINSFVSTQDTSLANTLFAISADGIYAFGSNSLGVYGVNSKGPAIGVIPKSPTHTRFSSISAGTSHAAAIETSTGYIYCWGDNTDGRLGNDEIYATSSPASVKGGRSYTNVAAAAFSVAALEGSTGIAYMWGTDSSGQLGDGSTVFKSIPVSVLGGRSFSAIAVGVSHSAAIEGSTGNAYAWGDGTLGQLGDGTILSKSSPVSVSAGRSYSAIFASAEVSGATFGIEGSTGNVYAWGSNNSGMLGQSSASPSNSSPVSVLGGRSYSKLFSGVGFVIAIEGSTGNAYAWGGNSAGQLGRNSVSSASSPVSVVGGRSYSSVGGADRCTTAIEGSTGNAYAWGDNSVGQLGNNTLVNASSPVSVVGGRSFTSVGGGRATSGASHSSAIEGSTGNLYTWGQATSGQLGTNSFVLASSPVSVFGGRSFSKVAMTGANTFGIEGSTGFAYAWGSSANGQLGNGSESFSSPVSVLGGRSYSSVFAKNSGNLAIEASTGFAYSWGLNSSGEIGDGSTTSQRSPTSVLGGRSYSIVGGTAGTSYLVEGSTGNAYACGLNNTGQLGDNSIINSSSPVSVVGGKSFSRLYGTSTAFAIEGPTGLLYAWGNGGNGQLGNNTAVSASSPVSVFGGRSYSVVSKQCAIEGSTGNAYAWGLQPSGQIGDGTVTTRSSPVSVLGGRSYKAIGTGGLANFYIEGSTGRAYITGTEIGYFGRRRGVVNPIPYILDPRLHNNRSFSSIAGGATGSNSMAIEASTGNAYAWGNGGTGQLGINNVSSVSSPMSVFGNRSFSSVGAGFVTSSGLEASTGTVFTWGFNNLLQLGNTYPTTTSFPVPVSGGRSYSAVSAEASHFIAIEGSTGNAYTWGSSVSGSLGNNQNSVDASSPVSVFGGKSFSSVAAGNSSCFAVEGSTGNAYSWGGNTLGQLGNQTTTNTSSPISVFGGRSFSKIACFAGNDGAVAIEGSTGNAYAWGGNNFGQLGDNSSSNRSSPVSVLGGRSFSAITCGNLVSVAIEGTTGRAYAWGYNGDGSLGINSTVSSSSPVSVFGARSFSKVVGNTTTILAIEGSTGNAYAWGLQNLGNNTAVTGSSPVSVFGGRSYSQIGGTAQIDLLIEGSTGRAYGWGDNTRGAIGDGTVANSSSPVSVFSSMSFSRIDGARNSGNTGVASVAIEGSTGNLWTWGNINSAIGYFLGTGNGASTSSPVSVIGGKVFRTYSMGASTSAAIENTTGNAYCWGQGGSGQLGNSAITDQGSPVSVLGGRSFSSISAGSTTVAIEGSTGNAYAWGFNSSGQIGDTSTVSKSSPVSVWGGRSFSKILSSAGNNTVAIEGATGNIYCWGTNGSGQLGDGTVTGRLSPVSVLGGRSFSDITTPSTSTVIALEGSTGFLYGWGLNNNGVVGDGALVSRSSPVSFTVGRSFSALFTGDASTVIARDGATGTLYSWGLSTIGDRPDATATSSPIALKRLAK